MSSATFFPPFFPFLNKYALTAKKVKKKSFEAIVKSFSTCNNFLATRVLEIEIDAETFFFFSILSNCTITERDVKKKKREKKIGTLNGEKREAQWITIYRKTIFRIDGARFVRPGFNRGQIERVRISSMQPVQLLNAANTARSMSVE